MSLSQGTIFQFKSETEPGTLRLIITHDCDIDSPKEQLIETLVIRHEPKNSATMNAKDSRELSFELKAVDGSKYYAHTDHKNREVFEKHELTSDLISSATEIIDQGQLYILKTWLARRYNRVAFPTQFMERLYEPINSNPPDNPINVNRRLKALLKRNSKLWRYIYFDLNGDKNRELSDDEPYFLDILLVVFDAISPSEDESVGLLIKAIKDLFLESFGEDADKPRNIILHECTSIEFHTLTVAETLEMDSFDL